MTDSTQPAKSKGWSFRRLFQYSIRSLLILTAVVAIASGWWVSTLHRGETRLPGGMVFFEQLRGVSRTQPTLMGAEEMVPHGQFTAVDKYGRVLARGWYDLGQPVGRWAVYHENGRTALSGRAAEGQRTEKWRVWDERGHQRLELAHGKPVVNADRPTSYGLGGGGAPSPTNRAAREGVAKIWHASGRLAASGPYRLDLREGHWTFWDEQGVKIAEGDYASGSRHGQWTLYDSPSAEPRTMWFLHGSESPEAPEQAAQAAAQLSSDDHSARFEAVYALGALGPLGVPPLVDLLAEDVDDDLARAALRVLSRLGSDGHAALPQIRRLAASSEGPTRLDALLALFSLDEPERDATFSRLLGVLDLDDAQTYGPLLDHLAEHLQEELPRFKQALASPDQHLRLVALHLLARVGELPVESSFLLPIPIPPPALLDLLADAERHTDPHTASTARDVRKALERLPSNYYLRGAGGGFF